MKIILNAILTTSLLKFREILDNIVKFYIIGEKMNNELQNDEYFNALLQEALNLGILSAMDCGHIKCLTAKIEAFYYNLAISEQVKQIEQFRNLSLKIKDYLNKQKIQEDCFNKFCELINIQDNAFIKLFDEDNQQEEVYTIMSY